MPPGRPATRARTRTMAAALGARAKVSCGSGVHRYHPSDDTWPLVVQRRGSRFWPGRTWQTRPRALALLRWLRAGSYVSWTPGTIDLIFDSMEIWGSNLLDMVCHVMRQCRTQPMTHRSPGPPPGFTTLRHTNASLKLVRYRWCWPQIYSCAAASMHARPYNEGDNDDEYTEDMLGGGGCFVGWRRNGGGGGQGWTEWVGNAGGWRWWQQWLSRQLRGGAGHL